MINWLGVECNKVESDCGHKRLALQILYVLNVTCLASYGCVESNTHTSWKQYEVSSSALEIKFDSKAVINLPYHDRYFQY